MGSKKIGVFVVVFIIILWMFASCDSGDRYDYGGEDYGANYDWGSDYYWDTNEHTVKEKSSCVAEGTYITMADGTQKQIEQIDYSDLILAFDHISGKYVHVNPVAVFNHGYGLYPTVDLSFSDGSNLSVINGHSFFDLNLMKYVDITPNNYNDYIGHQFAKYDSENTIGSTVLTSAKAYEAYHEAWGTWGFSSLTCITNGILSLPNAEGTYNYFEFDDNLKYDEESMAADVEEYGLYTYEEWSDLIPYEVFEGFNFKFFKVAIGKGLATYETYLEHIQLFNELSSK